jgi:hypothetical protein
MINTITDDQGNKYELFPYQDYTTDRQSYLLVYIPEFQEGDILWV